MSDLEVVVSDGALRLTLNRPEVFNALTGEMADEVAAVIEGATTRDDVRVVVVTGTGPAFSTGADISGADAHEGFDVTALDRANRIVRAIVGVDKPVVAAVNGVAAGVGCSAALAADIIVATESASFLLAFARIGLMPDGGATATVAASIGRGPGDADGAPGRAAGRPRGLRRRPGHPRRRRRGVRRRRSRRSSGAWPPGRRSRSPPPRRPSTPPPSTTSTAPSSANAPARPCC